MDMMGMDSMGGADTPLNASGLDLTNSTDASTFLGEILDDTELQVIANGYARDFWYGVVVIIGLAGIFNILQKLDFKMRIRAAAKGQQRPAVPYSLFSKYMATLTAIGREATYPQFTPTSSSWIKIPPLGIIILLLSYLVYVIILEFVNNDIAGAQHFTSLGIRAAWLAVAQVPLLILLAGKNNLIGFVTGVSYERLNVLHRWSARILLFLATLHLIFVHLAWNAYDLGPLEYSTDSCIPTGWAVYSVLLWLNISTIGPVRNLFYEFFVIQHILSWFGFVIAVIWHLPSTAYYTRVYIFIPIGLYIVDRLIRTTRYAYNNVRPAKATLTQMPGNVTKIRVKSTQIKTWTPGAHVFLSIPKLGLGQSHPATIASVPSSHGGDLVFLLKSHKGFTKRLHESATSSSTPLLTEQEKAESRQASQETRVALLDGPYGAPGADFAGFDSVLLISGSTGCSFTLPILLDLASRVRPTSERASNLPVKRIQFIWIVKNTNCTSWISAELQGAFDKLTAAGMEVEIRLHVTCDDRFTEGVQGEQKLAGCDCECDKSLGPCCCVSPVEGDEEKSKDIVNVNSSSTSVVSGSPVKNSLLKCATFQSGRPDIYSIVSAVLEKAEGETGVAVCGPLGLSSKVRTTVAKLSDERAVHKGSGAQGVFLHAECFGW